MEEAVKSGLAEALQENEESEDVTLTVKVPQIGKPAGEEETAALASSLVAAAFERAKQSMATSPQKTVLSLSSAGRDALSSAKQWKPQKKSPGKKKKTPKKRPGTMQTDGPAEAGLFLQLPLSRMSVAWSTASTRDEESAPASPTELDNIALGMVSTVEDYSSLLADLVIRDVMTMNSTPQPLVLTQYTPGDEERSEGLSYRVQTFLHSLEEARSFTSEPDLSLLPPFSPHCYNLRKSILRPVATGNRGTGGDPQLEAVLQWMAVSMCGRPEMRYHTFKEVKLQQVRLSG